MRITAKITSTGERWACEFPRIDRAACFPKNERGEECADPIACRVALKSDLITHAASDTSIVHAVACNWIDKVNWWKDENSINKTSTPGIEKTLDRLDRKRENGRVNFARASLTQRRTPNGAPCLVFDVSVTDDHAVERENYSRAFAMILAEAADICREELTTIGLAAELAPGAKTLFDDLIRWRGERAEEKASAVRRSDLLKMRYECERRQAGDYCSPCKFDCPFYRNGKCLEEAKAY